MKRLRPMARRRTSRTALAIVPGGDVLSLEIRHEIPACAHPLPSVDPQQLFVATHREHYENHYGGALRRLNAITEQLEALDIATAPGYLVNGLKRDELTALNSTLLHELYFAILGGEGKITTRMGSVLAQDFASLDRWRDEFRAMGKALAGGSVWVVLV